ncbi:uncharacterized protein K02A2.6-like [Podarcis raffonei]|uniref:uncharacterized protein K02A2.6-like n=1 Tax=Podarcis raffonei TaxID=65483 RepID=UPI0023294531|nr:uncharacterized protein K02A2.6-like [Podarcis raffonei]
MSFLEGLHVSHPGIIPMKALARSYVWWPGIDSEIEGWVKRCEPCQVSWPDPPKAPVQSWESTQSPWSQVHVDFTGPFQGQHFLIVVDSQSKGLEVVPTSTMSARATINTFRKLFVTHGLPDILVSNNGTTFTSAEFKEFVTNDGIHIHSAPFHPATNSQAERMVHTTKDALRRMVHGDWTLRLAEFLLAQHIPRSTVTGWSLEELLMGRRLTTLLDRIHPDRALEQQPSTVVQGAPRRFSPGTLCTSETMGLDRIGSLVSLPAVQIQFPTSFNTDEGSKASRGQPTCSRQPREWRLVSKRRLRRGTPKCGSKVSPPPSQGPAPPRRWSRVPSGLLARPAPRPAPAFQPR